MGSPVRARFLRMANINSCLRMRAAVSISRPLAISSSAETWSALSSDRYMRGPWSGHCWKECFGGMALAGEVGSGDVRVKGATWWQYTVETTVDGGLDPRVTDCYR